MQTRLGKNGENLGKTFGKCARNVVWMHWTKICIATTASELDWNI